MERSAKPRFFEVKVPSRSQLFCREPISPMAVRSSDRSITARLGPEPVCRCLGVRITFCNSSRYGLLQLDHLPANRHGLLFGQLFIALKRQESIRRLLIITGLDCRIDVRKGFRGIDRGSRGRRDCGLVGSRSRVPSSSSLRRGAVVVGRGRRFGRLRFLTAGDQDSGDQREQNRFHASSKVRSCDDFWHSRQPIGCSRITPHIVWKNGTRDGCPS